MTDEKSTSWLRSLVSGALLSGAFFLPLIAFLAAHRFGVVGPIKKLSYERTLILNMVLYWALATLLVAAWRRRRDVATLLRSQAPQLALLLFSLTISFVFAEVAMRLVRPNAAAEPFARLASETLHHRNAPGRRSLGMGDKWVETNEDGFRTPYSREDFHQFEHRIVLLGDSYTFGLGVDVQDGVAAVMESALREALGESVGVLNTGVISYSPYLERQAFVQVAQAYRPTLTLVLVDANDIGDDYQYESENVSEDPTTPRFDVPPVDDSGPSLCERSAICRALGPLWEKLGRPKQVLCAVMGWDKKTYDYYAFEVAVDGVKESNRFFILRHPLDATRPFFERTWENVEGIAEDVAAAGSGFGLVVMPRYFHWDDSECPKNWESDRYGVADPHENVFLEFFDDKAATGALPVYSLLGAFKDHDAASSEPAVFEHDPHWNEVGHRVAGEALARWLLDVGWPARALSTDASRGSFVERPSELLDAEAAPEDQTVMQETVAADGAPTTGEDSHAK